MTPSRPGRRTAALTAGLGLVAGSLLVATGAPASAAPDNDSAAAVAGADWLVDELNDDGLIENAQFGGVQYGLTIDAALSLADFDGTAYDAQLAQTTESLVAPANVDAYTRFDYDFDGERFAGTAAGATGKLLAYAEERGVTPSGLQEQMEGLVTEGGRIADGDETGNNDDFANVIGQTWAARGLAAAGSASAGDVTDFLLTQQCPAGFFPEGFGSGAAQACDAAADQPSVDTTAFAVLNLSATDPAAGSDVATAIDEAASWLQSRQAVDGSVGGANANSTGLSGWALSTVGRDTAAERAAAWVAGVQVAGSTRCEGDLVPAETGAIALGPTQFQRDTTTGINSPAKQDQWRLATAQALPVLRSLPARSEEATLTSAASGRYVRANAPLTLRVAGLAAGQKDCVAGPSAGVSVTGPGAVRVAVPRGTATRTYRLTGTDASVDVQPLVAKKLVVRRANTVARGSRQVVTVRDLAPFEKVTVRLRSKVVDTGVATRTGFFRSSFVVRGATGRAALKVTGQFPQTRSGTNAFQVR